MTIGILLMAAGKSRRFKAQTGMHKLLFTLPHQTKSMLTKSYQKLRRYYQPQNIIIVTNQVEPEIQALAATFESKQIIVQSDGLGSSIAQSVSTLLKDPESVIHNWKGLLILHADLPYISLETISLVDRYLRIDSPLTVRPTYQNKPGHPVGFRASLFSALSKLSGDNGARSILKEHPPHLLITEDLGILQDIDSVEDLDQSIDSLILKNR